MVLLAVCSSVVPLWWMKVRQEPITGDDLLYALVLWKYLGLYTLIRMSVSTERQIRRCLLASVGAACIVSVLAILQSLGLFGVPRLLATYYAPFGVDDAWAGRGSSTLGLPAATADLALYNLAIGLLRCGATGVPEPGDTAMIDTNLPQVAERTALEPVRAAETEAGPVQ